MLVRCINCGFSCQKYGKTKAGSQRWHCKQCNITFTQTIDNTTKCFHRFLKGLFSKETQRNMPRQGRTFRRQIADFGKYGLCLQKLKLREMWYSLMVFT